MRKGRKSEMYKIKKIDGMWKVVAESGIIQFSSLRRVNCSDWVKANALKEEQETKTEAK